MKQSYRIFRFSGISVELHLTFILFFLLLLSWGIYQFVFFGVIFTLVLVHELTHSMVAKRNGIQVPMIVLTPLGGLANIELPENPKLEFRISLAGPVSNFAFGIFCIALLLLTNSTLISYADLYSVMEINVSYVLSVMIWINFTLGLFNMLPAFPMDGGRIFRSMLASRMDYLRATKIAIRTGQLLFGCIILLGLLFGDLWWIMIGAFLLWAGGTEFQLVWMRYALRDLKVMHIARRDLEHVNADITVKEFLELIAKPGQVFYPISSDGMIVGVLNLNDLKGLKNRDFDKTTVKKFARGFAVVNGNLRVEDVITRLMSGGFLIVTDGNRLVGYLTPEHLFETARLYGIKRAVSD